MEVLLYLLTGLAGGVIGSVLTAHFSRQDRIWSERAAAYSRLTATYRQLERELDMLIQTAPEPEDGGAMTPRIEPAVAASIRADFQRMVDRLGEEFALIRLLEDDSDDDFGAIRETVEQLLGGTMWHVIEITRGGVDLGGGIRLAPPAVDLSRYDSLHDLIRLRLEILRRPVTRRMTAWIWRITGWRSRHRKVRRM